MSITDTMTHLIDHLEKGADWNKIFGVVESLYNDKGFSSNADNFARATAVEKAIDKFSDLQRVDQTGYDFIWKSPEGEEVKVEMKMGKNLFFKRTPHKTKKFKVKSFLSEKKTVEDFKQNKTFDYMLVLDLTAYRVIVVDDEMARSLYEDGADGAMIELNLGQYYECDLGSMKVAPILPPQVLSQKLEAAIDDYLNF
jgi:hypothetical protein